MWRLSRIGGRTLLVSAVPLGFLVLLLVVALVLQSRTALVAVQSHRLAETLSHADRAMQLVDDADQGAVAFARSGKAAALDPYRAAQAELPGTLDALAAAVTGQGDRARVRRLRAAIVAGMAVLEEFVGYARAHDKPAEVRLSQSPRVRALNAELEAASADFNSSQRAEAQARLKEIDAQIRVFTIVLLALCALGIAATVGVCLQFGLEITRRVLRLAENARRLAWGGTAQFIGGDDEIAELDRVYQAMMARSVQEQNRVTVLQRALLPHDVPALPGLRVDAAYLPAAGANEIGGDWYDVFLLGDRCVGMSVGDVAGHGLRAATLMGGVRQAIRTAAFIDPDPAAVLRNVNSMLCAGETELLITAFFATLDLATGTLSYALGGHPAPLVAKSGGAIETLDGSGFVLGVQPRAEYETRRYEVEVGCALVLFTDGLIESDRNYVKGLDDLRDAVEEEYRNADVNIAQAIVDRVFAVRPPRDDAALLFLGVTALGTAMQAARSVTWTVDARVERSARRVKRALLWHLGELAGEGTDLSAAELVVSELIGNVARHTPGPAEILLEWGKEFATVRVCDRGNRFEPPGDAEPISLLAESGRGLFLVRAMSAGFKVEWTGEGNCVSAVLRLHPDPTAIAFDLAPA